MRGQSRSAVRADLTSCNGCRLPLLDGVRATRQIIEDHGAFERPGPDALDVRNGRPGLGALSCRRHGFLVKDTRIRQNSSRRCGPLPGWLAARHRA